MRYFFLDETYRDLSEKTRIVIACVDLPQDRFSSLLSQARKLELPGRKSRLFRIRCFIQRAKGRVVVAYANIDKSLVLAGERDDPGLPGISRHNQLWSAVVTYAIAEMVASLVRSRTAFNTIDVFYDLKSLREDFREATGDVIRHAVKAHASDYIIDCGGVKSRIRFRKIEPVVKSPPGLEKGKYQIGIWLADRLCHYSDDLVSVGDSATILIRDCSSKVADIFIKHESANRSLAK